MSPNEGYPHEVLVQMVAQSQQMIVTVPGVVTEGPLESGNCFLSIWFATSMCVSFSISPFCKCEIPLGEKFSFTSLFTLFQHGAFVLLVDLPLPKARRGVLLRTRHTFLTIAPRRGQWYWWRQWHAEYHLLNQLPVSHKTYMYVHVLHINTPYLHSSFVAHCHFCTCLSPSCFEAEKRVSYCWESGTPFLDIAAREMDSDGGDTGGGNGGISSSESITYVT